MIHFRKAVFTVLILLIGFVNLFGQDILSYNNSLKYADHLFKNKQYEFSAIEYERITFIEPKDTLAKLRLIQSYRLMSNFNSAKAILNKYYPEGQIVYPENFANENFKILFLDHQYQNCFRFLQENTTINPTKKIEYEIGTLLMQNKWNDAKMLSENYLLSNPTTPNLDDLHNTSIKGLNLRYKNPYYAAFLSGIIPGSGKIYTNQWKDGLYAFIIISTFSYLTYNSIKTKGLNDNSIILGSVAFSFYAANIFGSCKSALNYNKKANANLTKNIEKMLIEK